MLHKASKLFGLLTFSGVELGRWLAYQLLEGSADPTLQVGCVNGCNHYDEAMVSIFNRS